MTDVPGGGGGSSKEDMQAARGAMQSVHELLAEKPAASVAEIQAVENYDKIPETVRRAIEGLSFGERLLVNQVFDELLAGGFQIQPTYVRGY